LEWKWKIEERKQKRRWEGRARSIIDADTRYRVEMMKLKDVICVAS
jgi:hypothetical protein